MRLRDSARTSGAEVFLPALMAKYRPAIQSSVVVLFSGINISTGILGTTKNILRSKKRSEFNVKRNEVCWAH